MGRGYYEHAREFLSKKNCFLYCMAMLYDDVDAEVEYKHDVDNWRVWHRQTPEWARSERVAFILDGNCILRPYRPDRIVYQCWEPGQQWERETIVGWKPIARDNWIQAYGSNQTPWSVRPHQATHPDLFEIWNANRPVTLASNKVMDTMASTYKKLGDT